MIFIWGNFISYLVRSLLLNTVYEIVTFVICYHHVKLCDFIKEKHGRHALSS